MKRIIIFSAVLFVFTAFTTEAKRFNNMSSYFYSELAPYGQWIEIDYGVVVWQPTIMQTGWAPYSMGRWVWTYDGWYWDSYESFGYVTYHYGRWFYDDYYGWLWYPDYEWAPAWVEWRYSNNYIGWAPLHPYATFSISIGIHFTNVFYTPYYHWHFITYNNFCHQHPYNYYVASNYRYRVHSNTRYRTNYSYHNGRVQNRGIDVEYVRVRSGQNIRQREITRVRDPIKVRGNHGNSNEIRTLDVSRDQLVRNDVKNMNVQKDRRKTSLDVGKVELDRKRTNTVTRNDNKVDRNIEKQRNDNKQKTDVKKDVERNVKQKNKLDKQRTQKDVKQKQVNTNKKSGNNNTNFDRTKVNKKTDTDRNIIKQNKTVKKNNVNRNKQNQVNTNKNNKNDRKIVKQNKTVKKNNVNRNKQNQVKKNNDRKTVVKKNNTRQKVDKKVNRNNTRTTTKTNKKKNTEKVTREKKQQKTTKDNNTDRRRKR